MDYSVSCHAEQGLCDISEDLWVPSFVWIVFVMQIRGLKWKGLYSGIWWNDFYVQLVKKRPVLFLKTVWVEKAPSMDSNHCIAWGNRTSFRTECLDSDIQQGVGNGFSWLSPNICLIVAVQMKNLLLYLVVCSFCWVFVVLLLFVCGYFRFFCLFGWFAVVLSSQSSVGAVTCGRMP